MHKLIYNGHSCDEFGIVISGAGVCATPERDVSVVSIPGRNGDIEFDNGRYKNVTVTYPAVILGDAVNKLRYAAAWLLTPKGYNRLEDDYNPDVYRMARVVDVVQSELNMYTGGIPLTLQFDCKPQKFLKSGEDAITVYDGMKLYNPTPFESKPLIKITGTGATSTLTVGPNTITITGLPASKNMIVDCDLQDSYTETVNCNRFMRGDFPTLKPGENLISFSAGITGVEIIPRWFVL